MSENIVEIKETLKKSYYSSVCCIIFSIFLLIVIAVFITNFAEAPETNFLMVIGTIVMLILGFIIIVLLIYLGSYFYGIILVMKGLRQNPFTKSQKNIFQFLHHAFPSVIFPLILSLLLLYKNLWFILITGIITINNQLYKPIVWSNSYPIILFKKLKLRI